MSLVLKFGFLFLGIIVVNGVRAAPLSGKDLCEKIYDSDDLKQRCLKVVSEKQFEAGALASCGRAKSEASYMVDCLDISGGRAFDANALAQCNRNQKPGFLNQCLKVIADESFELASVSMCGKHTDPAFLADCLQILSRRERVIASGDLNRCAKKKAELRNDCLKEIPD